MLLAAYCTHPYSTECARVISLSHRMGDGGAQFAELFASFTCSCQHVGLPTWQVGKMCTVAGRVIGGMICEDPPTADLAVTLDVARGYGRVRIGFWSRKSDLVVGDSQSPSFSGGYSSLLSTGSSSALQINSFSKHWRTCEACERQR